MNQLPKRLPTEIQTALAGPLSVLLGIAGYGLRRASVFNPILGYLLAELGRINFILAIFNLIPSFPMDGGRVFRAALVPRLGRLTATRIAATVGRGIAWVFGLLAVLPLLHGGQIRFSLLLIAFFVHQAAGAEARAAEWEACRFSGQPSGLFDDLLRKWR